MAKAKTKEGIKFTEEELKNVAEVKNNYNSITIRLGQLEMDRILLDETRVSVLKEYDAVRELEKQHATALTEKYGKGSLDIETGIFIPMK